MMLITDGCLLLCLGLIAFQDFKQRQISWYLIPLSFFLVVYKAVNLIDTTVFIKHSIFNIVFVLIQLILLTTYISIKNKALTNIVNTYLGIGDILFFIVVCIAFSPVNFIVFFIVSMILTLIGFMLYSTFLKKAGTEIPLAGTMATALIILLITKKIMIPINFYNDDYFLSMITK
jgi:hypothetical protein